MNSYLNSMDKEINDSEIFLRNLPVSGGFEVPSNYFESLEDRLQEGLVQTEKIEELPINSFEVPAAYFETLNLKILDRIEVPEAKKIPIKKQVSSFWLSGIAASFFLLALVFITRSSLKTNYPLNQEVSIEEVAETLDPNELNNDLLCDAGWCNEIEQIDSKSNDLEEDLLLDSDENLIIKEL